MKSQIETLVPSVIDEWDGGVKYLSSNRSQRVFRRRDQLWGMFLPKHFKKTRFKIELISMFQKYVPSFRQDSPSFEMKMGTVFGKSLQYFNKFPLSIYPN